MEIIFFLIPIIVALWLLLVKTKNVVWWEYFLLIGGSVLITLAIRGIIIGIKTEDTEYLGGYVTETTYYEPWNELVTVTHTTTDSEGNTHTYTTTEVNSHGPSYNYKTSFGDTRGCSKKEHEKIKNKFKVKPIFRDLHRNYYTKDGDAYSYSWSGKDATMITLTRTNKYRNPIKGSKSIFKLKRDGDSLLFDYPKIENKDQRVILGRDNLDDRDLRILNSRLGKKYQVRAYLLIFPDTCGPEIAEKQKEYWEGGNKNELIICLGVKGDSVVWCNPFSWCDSPEVEVRLRDWYIENPKLNIKELCRFLKPCIIKYWSRKNFKDFSYIKTELNIIDNIIILIITLIYTIGVGIYVVKNEYEN